MSKTSEIVHFVGRSGLHYEAIVEESHGDNMLDLHYARQLVAEMVPYDCEGSNFSWHYPDDIEVET